jgi:predicted nucleic acid-binding protein
MFVLDSSVTVAWYAPDEHTETAQALLDRVTSEGALVPLHWQLEVGNALLLATRRRRISPNLRNEALAQLLGLQITVDDLTLEQVWTASLSLADTHHLTLYDACYLELAQRRSLALATLDNELRAAARELGLDVLGA